MSMIASPQSQGQDLTGGNNIYNQIGYVSPMSDYSEASDLSTNLSSNNNYYIPHNTAAAGTSSHPDDNVQNLLNMILYGLTDSSSSSGGAELSNAAVATSTTSPAHSGADMFSATPLFDIGASSSSSSPEQQQRNLGTGGNYVIFQAEGIFESAERALREIKMDPEQELISRKREKGKSARKTLGGESTSITTEGGKKKPSTKKMLKSFAKKSISSVLDFAASKIATPASLPAAKSERNEVTQRKLGDASENLKADISRLSSTAKETSSSSPNKKLTMGFLLKKMKKAGGTKGAKKLIREVYEEYPDLFEDSLYNSGTTGMTRSPSQDSLEDTCLTADLESMFTTNLESSSQNVSTTNLSRESGKVMQRPGSPGKSISHMRDWSRDRLELKSAGSSDKLSSSSAVVNSKAAANDGASMIAVPAAPLQPAASSTSRIQRFFSRVGGGGGSNKSNDSYSDRNNNNSSTDYSKLQLPNRRMSAQSVNTVNTRCSVNSFNLLSILTPSSGGSNNSYPILGKKVTRSIRYEGSHESVEEGSNGGDEADLIMEMESLAVNSDSKTIDVLVNEWWDNPTGPDFEVRRGFVFVFQTLLLTFSPRSLFCRNSLKFSKTRIRSPLFLCY